MCPSHLYWFQDLFVLKSKSCKSVSCLSAIQDTKSSHWCILTPPCHIVLYTTTCTIKQLKFMTMSTVSNIYNRNKRIEAKLTQKNRIVKRWYIVKVASSDSQGHWNILSSGTGCCPKYSISLESRRASSQSIPIEWNNLLLCRVPIIDFLVQPK